MAGIVQFIRQMLPSKDNIEEYYAAGTSTTEAGSAGRRLPEDVRSIHFPSDKGANVQSIHFRYKYQSQRPAQPTTAAHAPPMQRSPRGYTSLRLPPVPPLLIAGVSRSRLLPLVTVIPFISTFQRRVWLALRKQPPRGRDGIAIAVWQLVVALWAPYRSRLVP